MAEKRQPRLAAQKYSRITTLDPNDPSCPDRMPFMARTDRFGNVNDWDVPAVAELSCEGGGTLDGPCGNLVLGVESTYDDQGNRVERPLHIHGSEQIAKKKFGRVSSYKDLQPPADDAAEAAEASKLKVTVPSAGLTFRLNGNLVRVGDTAVLIVRGELTLSVGTDIEVEVDDDDPVALQVRDVDQVDDNLCHVLCGASEAAPEPQRGSETVTEPLEASESSEGAQSVFDDQMENLFLLDEVGTAVPNDSDDPDESDDPVDLLDL